MVKRTGVKIGCTESYLSSLLAQPCPFNLENRRQLILTVILLGQDGINSVVSPSGLFNKSSRQLNDNWPLGQSHSCVCTEQVQEQGNRITYHWQEMQVGPLSEWENFSDTGNITECAGVAVSSQRWGASK